MTIFPEQVNASRELTDERDIVGLVRRVFAAGSFEIDVDPVELQRLHLGDQGADEGIARSPGLMLACTSDQSQPFSPL